MSKQPNSPQQGQQGQQRGETGTRQPQQFEAEAGSRFAENIRENMKVIGADGVRVGEVDRIEGDRIRLARADWPNDGAPGAAHHFLQLSEVRSIDGDTVRLASNAEAAQRQATRG